MTQDQPEQASRDTHAGLALAVEIGAVESIRRQPVAVHIPVHQAGQDDQAAVGQLRYGRSDFASAIRAKADTTSGSGRVVSIS
jgi:hypothetical protein